MTIIELPTDGSTTLFGIVDISIEDNSIKGIVTTFCSQSLCNNVQGRPAISAVSAVTGGVAHRQWRDRGSLPKKDFSFAECVTL